MKAIITCVNYGEYLAETLYSNAKHFDEVLVVTTPADELTRQVIEKINYSPFQESYVKTFLTDAFYKDGAMFNKGFALEEGFEALGRSKGIDDWIMVLDADILLPTIWDNWKTGFLTAHKQPTNCLYSPYRRMCKSLSDYKYARDTRGVCYRDWPNLFELNEEGQEFAGYCQIFNSKDPVLQTTPWYPTDYHHAGGCDSVFSWKWDKEHRVRPSFEVLHIGSSFQNWCGTSDVGRKKQAELQVLRNKLGYWPKSCN
jgi:hypothetical protein